MGRKKPLPKRNPEPAGRARRLRPAILGMAAIVLLGLFSTEIADTNFWWHLKTGQYIVEWCALPVPDPFAYTTALAPGVYRFNLTHEWLAQAILFVVYATGGFPLVILIRGALLAGLCGLSGLLAARLSGNFYAGIGAAFATASVAIEFSAGRPGIVSFLGVAVFVALLETRRALWLLPVIALFWANCHGGFFLGWLVLLAYCATSRDPRLWLTAASAISVSGLNPNGFHVLAMLAGHGRGEMDASLVEWHRPLLWGPPYGFDLLLYSAAIILALAWRRVRPAHWILFAAFAAASLMAFRNILLIGFLAPVLIAAYFPWRLPRQCAWALLPLVALPVARPMFQLRVADWTIPAGAADYLLANRITGRLFNTYEHGGYLIWRLWPQQRVFIDSRALSDSLYRDYRRILFNQGSAASALAGPRAELLDRYGIDVVVMNTLDSVSGAIYPLALALANPDGPAWKLIYEDSQSVIFLRHAAPRIPVIPDAAGRVPAHMDKECTAYIEHSPGTPNCARNLADYWMRNGVRDRARRMLRLYLAHAPKGDPEAEQALRRLEAP